jgi:catechol 2,3-dioxygenase-like lactoylglutathione lyase family enzyme
MDGRLAIHHLALRARDVEVTARFYTELLGLEEVRAERPRTVWLGLAEGGVLMVEATSDGEPRVPVGSMDLFAFRVTDAERRTIREASRARGCFDGETTHTVYLRDPDGRRVAVSTHPLTSAR